MMNVYIYSSEIISLTINLNDYRRHKSEKRGEAGSVTLFVSIHFWIVVKASLSLS